MSTLHILNQNPSIANNFIAELRDVQVQRDSMRFRRNLERLGEIFAYEISKTQEHCDCSVTTPLGNCQANTIQEMPVLATVLRAGLPLYQGLLNIFDKADSAFAGAYRLEGPSENLQINLDYLASPSLENRVLILADPMLATGKSLVLAYQQFTKHGKPKTVHIVAAVASKQGVAHLQQHIPEAHLWIGAVDNDLNASAYIVPGLGDAGDLAFGAKL